MRLTRFLRESTVARMSTIDTSGSPATSSQDALFTFSASPGFTTECSLDGAAFRRCSSPRTYHGLAAGLHTFCIRAVQGALQESVPDCRTWRIVGPGAPDAAIDAAPLPLTPSHDATFRFHADQPATRFECRLDASAFRSCSSELTYHGLALGPHTFSVRAVNFAGETDASPATWSWTVG